MPLINPQITSATDPPFPAGVVRLEYTSGLDGLHDWAMLWPPQRGHDWLIFIHGHGSTGDQLYTRPDIREVYLAAFRGAGLGVAALDLRGNAWMSPAAVSDTADILDYLRRTHAARRFIFASGSMAGTANLIYAVVRPQDVAGVIALCPATDLTTYHAWCRLHPELPVLGEIADAIELHYRGPPKSRPDTYEAHSALRHAEHLTMPAFVSHGDADNIIPVYQSRCLAKAVGKRPTYFYEELPGGTHDAPLYSMPRAVEWAMKRMGTGAV